MSSKTASSNVQELVDDSDRVSTRSLPGWTRPETMTAFAMLRIGEVGFITKEVPKLGSRDALIRPLKVSVCTSDPTTVYKGAIGERNNMVLGHESVGQVVEVGRDVKDFHPGQRVLVSAITPNWSHESSQRGFPMHSDGMCQGWKFSNCKDGVFAEYYHVNDADANLCLLPDDVTSEQALMLSDMATTGFLGPELAEVAFGETVCVIGIGPVGLMSVTGARLHGASTLIGVGSRPRCRELAEEYGCTHVISYKDAPIAEQVLAITEGAGVDKVIIAGGDCDTFIEAVKMVKPGGIISNIAYLGGAEYVRIPRQEWGVGMAHKTIKGGLCPGGRLRMERLVKLIQTKRFDPAKLITHRFNGLEGCKDALEMMHHKPQDIIKTCVSFSYEN